MGKIYVLIGKSASGKDSVYTELIRCTGFKPYVIHTTRPKRNGETDGVEYYFSDETQMKKYELSGQLIESRMYNTVYGPWYYFTVADESTDLSLSDFLYIGTLESYKKMRDFFGKENVIPLYIELDDKSRLIRAIERESLLDKPGYGEVCRRYLADEKDFSEENLAAAGIKVRFRSDNTKICAAEIQKYLSAAKNRS